VFLPEPSRRPPPWRYDYAISAKAQRDIPFKSQLEQVALLAAVGGGAGCFVCWVSRYLLPGLDFDYGKWGGIGTALGFATGLVWFVTNTLIY
jgi:hypothetical protein